MVFKAAPQNLQKKCAFGAGLGWWRLGAPLMLQREQNSYLFCEKGSSTVKSKWKQKNFLIWSMFVHLLWMHFSSFNPYAHRCAHTKHTHTHTNTRSHTYIHTYIHTYTCIYTNNMPTNIHMHAYTCAHITCTHTCSHTHWHTHIHIYTHFLWALPASLGVPWEAGLVGHPNTDDPQARGARMAEGLGVSQQETRLG